MLAGFVILIWSADKFVESAALTAQKLGVSTLVIGLTIVSLGTSAPEIFVAIGATIDGEPAVAIGNAIGSNIANIGLVLGITAMLVPLPFASSVLKSEMPWLLLVTGVVAFCLFDLHLSRVDGLILLALLAYGMYSITRRAKRTNRLPDEIEEELAELSEVRDVSLLKSATWLVVGLLLLLVSSQMVVVSAIWIAHALNVSEHVIGLTVVAIGTSLPELAATVTAALKGHQDIAIGNVVGSNILNLLAVLPIPALLVPSLIQVTDYWRDLGMMVALTVLLALFAYGIRSKKVVTRFEGFVFFAGAIGYLYIVGVHEIG